jgi:hypothetical protein
MHCLYCAAQIYAFKLILVNLGFCRVDNQVKEYKFMKEGSAYLRTYFPATSGMIHTDLKHYGDIPDCLHRHYKYAYSKTQQKSRNKYFLRVNIQFLHRASQLQRPAG